MEAGPSDEKSVPPALINFGLCVTDFCRSLEMKLKYRLKERLKNVDASVSNFTISRIFVQCFMIDRSIL